MAVTEILSNVGAMKYEKEKNPSSLTSTYTLTRMMPSLDIRSLQLAISFAKSGLEKARRTQPKIGENKIELHAASLGLSHFGQALSSFESVR